MAKKQYLDNIGLDTLVDKIKSWVLGLGYTDNTGTITEVSTSTPLSGGGTSGTVSLSHDNSGVSAGSYGDSAAQTPAFGGTFKVNYETVNATGHVTGLTSHNVTIPNTTATTSTAGLISASDKSKLDGIASGATANDGTITGITTTSPLSGSGTSGSVALSHENSGATAGSYGDSSAQTPAFGGTFKVNYETVNTTGHVTALSSHNVTIPNTEATTSAAGLMSAEDKENLDSVSELADETYDMVMSGEANGWLMDENGNVILSDDDTGITMDWDICRVTYEAGTGLSLDGNVFNHSNQVDAGTVGNDIEETLEIDGSFVIPYIAYDAQGHITKAGITTFIMSDVTESDIDSIFATASPSGYPDDDDDDSKVAPGPEIVDPDNTDDGNSGNDNPDDDNDGDDNPDGNENGDDGDEMPAPDPGFIIPSDNEDDESE